MVTGQKVTIKVDAFLTMILMGQWPFACNRCSLYFASDNATGNFVKTIQRLPVKISLDSNNDVEK
jgi:membrane fusion protein (multidrug efflux system)